MEFFDYEKNSKPHNLNPHAGMKMAQVPGSPLCICGNTRKVLIFAQVNFYTFLFLNENIFASLPTVGLHTKGICWQVFIFKLALESAKSMKINVA